MMNKDSDITIEKLQEIVNQQAKMIEDLQTQLNEQEQVMQKIVQTLKVQVEYQQQLVDRNEESLNQVGKDISIVKKDLQNYKKKDR